MHGGIKPALSLEADGWVESQGQLVSGGKGSIKGYRGAGLGLHFSLDKTRFIIDGRSFERDAQDSEAQIQARFSWAATF